jgi:Cu(I)/Ag(I) efflux system membrane fusion protein
MIGRGHLLLGCLLSLGSLWAQAQGVRSRTRPATGTTITETQAADLTLTLSAVAVRPIQAWARGGATIDKSGKMLTVSFDPRDVRFVKVGQRARAFTPQAKSQMLQAYVTRIQPQGRRVSVEVTLSGQGWKDGTDYVVEIVAEAGEFLSVPNEAVIEEGDKHIVYVQQRPGEYVPQEIDIGVQGELYTQVLSGLNAADQVVTFGSFFVDSEYKLKGPVAAQ